MKCGNIGKQVVLGWMRELGENCSCLWPCELGSPERQPRAERDQRATKEQGQDKLSVQSP